MNELPTWARWAGELRAAGPTLGVEEEVMLLEPQSGGLAHAIDELLPRLPPELQGRVHPETHAAAAELATGVHRDAASAVGELRTLRAAVRETAYSVELEVASAGTHPFAVWRETTVSGGPRSQILYGAMRELARREPSFALHVHVGVRDPEHAISAVNRMRPHLPLLLALSANSPFWQGRDTGLASARTPIFQAFPRVGIPRAFSGYEDYVRSVDLLLRLEAFPEPTFLWWDVRPQPSLGTVEIRIMDAQQTLADTAALVALVQCLVALELSEGYSDERAAMPEVLVENRFLAARDGVRASLIDPIRERLVPVAELVEELMPLLIPHAEALACVDELAGVERLLTDSGAARQRDVAGGPERLRGLVAHLVDQFV
ncbi:MAG TPA: YbdK family carboxylate-amine ligase [Solirubrobacteraceae bacterium]|nr:YbdK family carboxylate-amine ligase [Solirubrobacteraceae bacterium]